MAVGLAVVGNGAQEHASLLYYVISGAVGTLLMLGRALTWGRLRRAFWILPPHWLDQQLAVAAERQQE